MSVRVHAVVLTGLAVLMGGIACGGGDDGTSPPESGRKTVLVANNEFQPVMVTIEPGDTVLWSWVTNSVDHNILSNGGSFDDKGDSVGTVNGVDLFTAPANHQVIFPTAGTYRYFCSAHGVGGTPNTGMAGTVVVE